MFTHVRIRTGRWLALILGIGTLTSAAQAQIQQLPLRGPPLSSRPPNQQITFTDPTTGQMVNVIVPQHVSLMPGSHITPLNNGSLGDFPIGNNNFVFGYPPEMQGPVTGGGMGGGIGGLGGGIGGLGGGIGGIGGGIGGLGGGIGGLGGGIGGLGGGIGGLGGGIGGFGGGLGGGFGGVFGARTFLGGPNAGYTGFGGNFNGFGGAIGAVGGGGF
jgi:hypothetical protein